MVELKDVSIQYGAFKAVNNINFTVKNGEFFTLLGPSGCGKTTTLRAISGFEKVSSGKILIDGEDMVSKSPEEREIGFVFQNYALFPSMTVFDNIAFGLKIRHIKKDIIRNKVNLIAELTGITEHLNKKISQLSGGQQQRIAIARALVLNPKLLLMDEPLSNLDAKLRISMRSEIKRIQKELGIVAIYVTHDQEEALAISDRIAVFNNGVIEQIGAPQEIYHHPKTEFVSKFVGAINEISKEGLTVLNKQSKIKLESRCFVRTEKVHICYEHEFAKIPTENIVCEGVVHSSEFLGATSQTSVDIGGGTIMTSMNFDSGGFSEGDRVFVYFSKSDMIVFG